MASKRQSIQVIFFDLGDTLIYFNGDWKSVLQKSTESLWNYLVCAGYPLNQKQFSQDFSSRMKVYYSERNKNYIEYTSASVLKDCLVDLGFSTPGSGLIKNALDAMYSVSQEFWYLEEDAIPLLEWLYGLNYRIGLISNASDKDDVISLLNNFNLQLFFEHIIISAEFGLRKPHPQIFLEGLRRFNVEPEKCLMVGDRLDMDIQGANHVSIPSIWIKRRSIHTGNEDQFSAKPDFIVDTLLDIKEIVNR